TVIFACKQILWSSLGTISIGQLNTLLCLHLQPITWWSTTSLTGNTYLRSGFTLRCIQRLSMLHLATERYCWHDNSYTRGGSIPVLSSIASSITTWIRLYLHPLQIFGGGVGIL